MYRFFENLVDPFANVPEGTPPGTLWAYLKTQIAPFRHLVLWIALSGLLVALIEGGLIFYGGRLIDLMNAAGPAAFWAEHGLEAVLVALFILLLRPAFIGLNALLLGQTLSSNLSEQARWRAHKHMLGQSASFFQNSSALAPGGGAEERGGWGESRIALPEGRWRDALTGVEHEGGMLPLAVLLEDWPVALLVRVGATPTGALPVPGALEEER